MKRLFLLFYLLTLPALMAAGAYADDYEDYGEEEDLGDYAIDVNDNENECRMESVAINDDAEPVAVGGFDIAGIMLGMNFDQAQMTARETGLYTNRAKNSVVYSIHKDWKYSLDYECRQQKIYAPEKLERCINSLARKRGVLYAAELHLVRETTGETIDVYFTSNATDNVVWKIVYKNDVDVEEGDAEKFSNQKNKKIMKWWQSVLDKYGAPNAGNDKWASSDNAYDPLMTAYYGELDMVDCGIYGQDDTINVQQSEDNFMVKPYAF